MEAEIESLENESSHQNVDDIFKKPNLIITIKFEDVVHKINIKSRGHGYFYVKHGRKCEEKMILKGISGAVSPGDLLAILGPSGSGKTTLLTALGGRLCSGETRGNITYNNKPLSAKVKRKIGFVAQSNVFYPHLTVTETLVFTALLRLPKSVTAQKKISQAEEVINKLGLTLCKDTIVGGRIKKGISGGEKKRVSIGQELLLNPSLLSLDEPTSGLDSTIAKQILLVLSRLAESRRTILMTIHQPASGMFYMFNKVLLLSEGNSLYFGKGNEVMSYFASIGYEPSVAMNPSDFLLDLANGVISGDPEQDRKAVQEVLVSAYKSNLYEKLKAEFQEIGDQSLIGSEESKNSSWCTTWWQQFFVLLKRDLRQRRHESFSGLKIGHILIISIITGLIWWQSDTANITDQVGLLFFYSRFAGFFPFFQAINTFPLERKMLEKERSSGMYRLSSYFMAKTIGDLPMELGLPAVFIIITYWMGGLKHTAANFFYTLSVSLYTAMVAQSLGLAIGAVVMDQKMAATIAATLVLLFLVTGGFFVQHVPAFISWLQYLSLTYYSYKLLLLSQFKASDTFICSANVTCLVGDFPRIKLTGLDHQVLCVAALALMLVGFRLVAYLALIRVGARRN